MLFPLGKIRGLKNPFIIFMNINKEKVDESSYRKKIKKK